MNTVLMPDLKPIKSQLVITGQQLLNEFAVQLEEVLPNRSTDANKVLRDLQNMWAWSIFMPSAWLRVYQEFKMEMAAESYEAVCESDKENLLAEFVKNASLLLNRYEQDFFDKA